MLSSLTLTVTERCNLRCSYCYVPFEEGRVMKPEVVDAAVELLAKHAGEGETTLSFFGGEPLLASELCRRAVDGARKALDDKRHLRVLMPTNGLELDDETLGWCRSEDVDLALSIDGDAGETERRFADGRPVAEKLLPRVPELLRELPRSRVLARMTVTPANVGRLARNVRALARMGFRRIVYLVAWEEDWSDDAIAAWGREHRRLGTWLVGAHAAGARVPDLPGWRAIEERILLGKPRRACGAGHRIAAVSPEGDLYPCYRLVYRGDDDGVRLGNVHSGFTETDVVARFAEFDPNDVRPEHGDCASCSANDGCTHACPAIGWTMLRDVGRVPAVACRMMREQVAAIRPYAAIARRPTRRPWATALVAAAAVTAIGAAPACGGSTSSTGIAQDGGPGGNSGGGTSGYGGGGMCPVQVEGGIDTGAGGYGGGGICPVQVDAGDDGAATGGYGGGGICPVQVDAGDDGAASGGYGGGGICPVQVDAGEDAGTGGFGAGGGGVCPFQYEGGGLC